MTPSARKFYGATPRLEPGPSLYKSVALPTELRWRDFFFFDFAYLFEIHRRRAVPESFALVSGFFIERMDMIAHPSTIARSTRMAKTKTPFETLKILFLFMSEI